MFSASGNPARAALLCALVASFASGGAAAQEASAQEALPEEASAQEALLQEAPPAAASHASLDLYLSGYALHSRHTYTGSRLARLNEKAWGAGLGKTWRNDSGNDASLYLMAIRDSSRRWQWMAGYAYEWMHHAKASGVEAGIGLTAGIIRRHDWFHGKPFPAVLPVASVGTAHAKLTATYVPHIPRGKGQGNVLLLQLKLSF